MYPREWLYPITNIWSKFWCHYWKITSQQPKQKGQQTPFRPFWCKLLHCQVNRWVHERFEANLGTGTVTLVQRLRCIWFLKKKIYTEQPLLWTLCGKRSNMSGAQVPLKWEQKLCILGNGYVGKHQQEMGYTLSISRTFIVTSFPSNRGRYDEQIKCKNPSVK